METLADTRSEGLVQTTYEGFYASGDFIDRQQIEARARRLINHQETRPVTEVLHQERRDNARTTLMEALTASGHLSRVEINGASLEDINSQVLSRLLNGWDESLPFHEKQRRFAELCNELVIQGAHAMVDTGELPESIAVAEISDYPVALDDKEAASLGYRRANRKGMVRSTHLRRNDDGSYTRIIEQPSRSNGTPASSFRFFKAAGLPLGADRLADVSVLRAPFLYSTDDYVDGAVDIMRRLDEQELAPVLYGDTVDKSQRHVPYQMLRQESARREAEIEDFIGDLADLEEQLDRMKESGELGREERLSIFKGEVDRILTAICTLEPAYADDTFGRKAGAKFVEAGQLYLGGHADLAQQALASAHYLKEEVTFCGMSISVEAAQQQRLRVSGYKELLEKGQKNWKFKKGICVVPECPKRKKKEKVDVGPCSVCRDCQKIYNNGDDPKMIYAVLSFLDWLFSAGEKNT